MQLTSISIIKNLLRRHNLRAKKSLGQHFLTDKNILKKIINTAKLSKKDVVLEVGSGIGTLTKELSQRVKKVIAVEIDRKMTEILKETLKDLENVKIVEGDVLKIDNLELKTKDFKIVANIPYQITSPLLEKFLTAREKPKLIVLMIQEEVAEKICSKPPRMNRLAILVQLYGKPEIVAKVSKNCFWPKPEVESAILRITLNKKLKIKNQKDFFDMVKQGFSQKRKQLKNIFEEESLKNAGIMPQKRAENLSVTDWIKLYHVLKQKEDS